MRSETDEAAKSRALLFCPQGRFHHNREILALFVYFGAERAEILRSSWAIKRGQPKGFDRADINNIAGAPSLRFVQGRVRCCR